LLYKTQEAPVNTLPATEPVQFDDSPSGHLSDCNFITRLLYRNSY